LEFRKGKLEKGSLSLSRSDASASGEERYCPNTWRESISVILEQLESFERHLQKQLITQIVMDPLKAGSAKRDGQAPAFKS
jgi:hypothetical protein